MRGLGPSGDPRNRRSRRLRRGTWPGNRIAMAYRRGCQGAGAIPARQDGC
jgi:hypothetical protein